MNEKELMLTSILECSRAELYHGRRTLDRERKLHFNRMRMRREQGEPLQYILGETEFMGLPMKVNSNVLIPRPETELMVEAVAERAKMVFKRPVNILDIGTGSGNIAISLAVLLPGSQVTAIDCSFDALETAAANADCHGVTGRVNFLHCGMADFLGKVCRPEKFFDIIISNPPYIPAPFLSSLPLDVRQEPLSALEAGEDGLFFHRIIVGGAGRLIGENGFLAMEFGDGQDTDLKTMFEDAREFTGCEFFRDYTGVLRFLIAGINP